MSQVPFKINYLGSGANGSARMPIGLRYNNRDAAEVATCHPIRWCQAEGIEGLWCQMGANRGFPLEDVLLAPFGVVC